MGDADECCLSHVSATFPADGLRSRREPEGQWYFGGIDNVEAPGLPLRYGFRA